MKEPEQCQEGGEEQEKDELLGFGKDGQAKIEAVEYQVQGT